MNPAIYSVIILVVLLIIFKLQKKKKMLIKKKITSKKRRGSTPMLELARKFIEKECLIYTFDSQVTGIIKEVTDNALLIDNNGCNELINLDFVVRIREYPKNKKGKKKSVVVD